MRLSVVGVLFSFILFGSLHVHAQMSAFRGGVGFTRGALNLTAEYESRQSNIRSNGGYFFMQTEKTSAGIGQVMALGGYMPLHLLAKNVVDLYVAPGFGIAMVKVTSATGGSTTETGIGPSLKIGAEYRTSDTVSVGLQYSNYYNWFAEKAPAGDSFSSAAMTFLF